MDTCNDLSVREVREQAILDQIYRLRVLAWVETEVGAEVFPSGEWTDEYDPMARHWVVVDGVDVVAACRLTVYETLPDVPCAPFYARVAEQTSSPYGVFSRLVVLERARRKGISRRLDHARLTAAVEEGCKTIVGYSHRPDRVRALCRKGFRRANDWNSFNTSPGGDVTPYFLEIDHGWKEVFSHVPTTT